MDLGDYGVCPLCLEKGKTVKLLFYRLNFMEVCLLCPDKTCPYPVVDGAKDIFVKVKDIPELSSHDTSDELYYVNPEETVPQNTGDAEDIKDRAVFDIEDIDFDAMIIEDGDLGTIIRTLDLEAAASVDKMAVENSGIVEIQENAKSEDNIGEQNKAEGNMSMMHGEVPSVPHEICEIDDAAILEDLLNAVEDQQPFDFDINFPVEQDCGSNDCRSVETQETPYKSSPEIPLSFVDEVLNRPTVEREQLPNRSVRKVALEGAVMNKGSKESRSCSLQHSETKDALSLSSLLSLLSKTTLTESGSNKADELESIEAQLIAHFKKAPITYCRLNRIKAACKHAATASIENKIPVPAPLAQESGPIQEPAHSKKSVKTYCKPKHTKKHKSCCKEMTDQVEDRKAAKGSQNPGNSDNRKEAMCCSASQKLPLVVEARPVNPETNKNAQSSGGISKHVNRQRSTQSSSQNQSHNSANNIKLIENGACTEIQSSRGETSANVCEDKATEVDKNTPGKMTKRMGKSKRRKTKEKRKSVEEIAPKNDVPVAKEEIKTLPLNKKKSGYAKNESQQIIAQSSKVAKSSHNKKT